MAATYDNSTGANTGAINSATLTYSHTTAGTNRALVVFSQSSVAGPTGVTYAGVAMTQLGTAISHGSGFSSAWIQSNPTVGANNVVVTCAASQVQASVAVSANTAKQTTSVTNANANSVVASVSVGITTPTANALIIDGLCISANSTTGTPSNGQTARATTNSSSGQSIVTGTRAVTTATSYTEGWSQSPFTNNIQIYAVAIEDATVTSTPSASILMMMGV